MQIRLESSRVAANIMDADVQLETRASAAQRLEKWWLNLCVKWAGQKRNTLISISICCQSTFEKCF